MKRYIVERVKTGRDWPSSEEPNRVRIAGYFATRDEAVAWVKEDMEASRAKWPELGCNTLMVNGEDYTVIGSIAKSVEYMVVKVTPYEMLLNKLRKMRWISGDFPLALPHAV